MSTMAFRAPTSDHVDLEEACDVYSDVELSEVGDDPSDGGTPIPGTALIWLRAVQFQAKEDLETLCRVCPELGVFLKSGLVSDLEIYLSKRPHIAYILSRLCPLEDWPVMFADIVGVENASTMEDFHTHFCDYLGTSGVHIEKKLIPEEVSSLEEGCAAFQEYFQYDFCFEGALKYTLPDGPFRLDHHRIKKAINNQIKDKAINWQTEVNIEDGKSFTIYIEAKFNKTDWLVKKGLSKRDIDWISGSAPLAMLYIMTGEELSNSLSTLPLVLEETLKEFER